VVAKRPKHTDGHKTHVAVADGGQRGVVGRGTDWFWIVASAYPRKVVLDGAPWVLRVRGLSGFGLSPLISTWLLSATATEVHRS
jgi:hypothetical protein